VTAHRDNTPREAIDDKAASHAYPTVATIWPANVFEDSDLAHLGLVEYPILLWSQPGSGVAWRAGPIASRRPTRIQVVMIVRMNTIIPRVVLHGLIGFSFARIGSRLRRNELAIRRVMLAGMYLAMECHQCRSGMSPVERVFLTTRITKAAVKSGD